MKVIRQSSGRGGVALEHHCCCRTDNKAAFVDGSGSGADSLLATIDCFKVTATPAKAVGSGIDVAV
jgi:hypothetical protein